MRTAATLTAAAALALALALPCAAEGTGVALTAENFPDPVLLEAVSEKDYDGNGTLSRSELSYISYLWLDDTGLSDLTGIELLTGLETLYCDDCELTHADLSRNTALTSLSLRNNPLESYVLPAGLEDLDLSKCGLTELDVTGLARLERLNVSQNQLTALDVSGMAYLESLDAADNRLTELKVAGCARLEYLACSTNDLTGLDLTGCTALRDLNAYDNDLTTLDLAHCAELEDVGCGGNRLTAVALPDTETLTWLSLYDNKLTALDLTGCPGLNRDNVLLDSEVKVQYASLWGIDWAAAWGTIRAVMLLVALVGAVFWAIRRARRVRTEETFESEGNG